MTETEQTAADMPAVKRLMDEIGVEIRDAEFIPGGKTNESFKVEGSDGRRYLARIAGAGTEHFIDRKKELHNIEAAGRISVSPKLFCADGGNLLLEYIDGTCSPVSDVLLFDGNVKKAAEELHKLHDSGTSFDGDFSFIRDFEIYKSDFLSTGAEVPPEMKKQEDALFEMTRWVDESEKSGACPVHSDLKISNFIFTKERAYIIDWEYSTMADPCLDLASFCTQNLLAPGVERLFLKSYFSGPAGRTEENGPGITKEDYDKFLLYKMAISFMWVYWHLNRAAHGKDVKYNEFRWRMFLNNAVMCKEEWEERQREPSVNRSST